MGKERLVLVSFAFRLSRLSLHIHLFNSMRLILIELFRSFSYAQPRLKDMVDSLQVLLKNQRSSITIIQAVTTKGNCKIIHHLMEGPSRKSLHVRVIVFVTLSLPQV